MAGVVNEQEVSIPLRHDVLREWEVHALRWTLGQMHELALSARPLLFERTYDEQLDIIEAEANGAMAKLEANRKVAFQLTAAQLHQAKLEAMWMRLPEFAATHNIEVKEW